MPEMKKNLILKQKAIQSDLKIKVPLSRIAYALSRQPLTTMDSGVDLRKMAIKKNQKFIQ